MIVGLVAAAAIAALGFRAGGYFPQMWSWVSFALAWTALATIIVTSPARWARRENLMVAAFGLLAAWTLFSAVWSVDSSASVRESERALLYVLGVAVLVLLARGRAVAEIAAGVFVATALVTVYALTQHLLASPLEPDRFEGFLLFRPVGYANAVGIVAVIAILLALGFVLHEPRRAARAAAAAALVPMTSALVLTSSRASVLALGVGVACLLALEPDRPAAAGKLMAVAIAPLIAVWLTRHAGLLTGPLFKDGAAERLAIELILLTAAAAVVPLFRAQLPRGLALAVAAAALVAVVVAGTTHRPANPYGEERAQYWHVAWREWTSHPVLGSGAGTFGAFWNGGRNRRGAQDAHNLYLETLAELGPIGLGLLLTGLALPLAALGRTRRSPYVPALFGAYAAYLLHAGFDWDWELPVVTFAALSCGSALLLAARAGLPQALAGRARITVGALAVAVLVIACIELVANDAVA